MSDEQFISRFNNAINEDENIITCPNCGAFIPKTKEAKTTSKKIHNYMPASLIFKTVKCIVCEYEWIQG